MKGTRMESRWRTVQLFISAQFAGIFEVEINTETKKTRCNCPVFTQKTKCKHTKFVDGRLVNNSGHYSILVPHDVSEDLALEASEDPKKFREFVLKYAKVEVL
jgi:hypothetical protein